MKENGKDNIPNIEKSSQILFVNYKALKNDGAIRFELINFKKVDGKLKNTHPDFKTYDKETLIGYQLDSSKNPVDSFIVTNPFRKSIEYVSSSGELNKKHIELDSTTVSIRVQLNHEAKYLSVVHQNLTISTIEL